jgi:RNA polymerase sigma-70 factor (ECF subfamily)
VDQGSRLAITRWVVREVLVHEPALRAWLRRTAGASDVEDIVQESYCRISSLKDVSHIRNGRAYLFTTARMIILEKIRRSRVVNIETVIELDKLQISSDLSSPEDEIVTQNYLNHVKNLIEDLPSRCRSVFQMRKIEGLSQREVATRLGIAEHTVENDVAKGLSLILKAIADGEQQAEACLESMDGHGRAWRSTGNQ